MIKSQAILEEERIRDESARRLQRLAMLPFVHRGSWHATGVYILTMGQRVIYVGQSKNIHQRIQGYLFRGKPGFDRYYFVECESCDVNEIERALVALFRPSLNTNLKGRMAKGQLAKVNRVLERYDLTWLTEELAKTHSGKCSDENQSEGFSE